MDFLKNAIKDKKREKKKFKNKLLAGNKRSRFVRVGDIEKIKRKEYFSNIEEESTKKPKTSNEISFSSSTKLAGSPIVESEGSFRTIPKDEVIRLLRELEQPITLFGEDDEDRLKRLRYHQTHKTVEEKKKESKLVSDGIIDYLLLHEESEKLLFKTNEEVLLEVERKENVEKIFKNKTLPTPGLEEERHEYILKILTRLIHDWEVEMIKTQEHRKMEPGYKRERKIHFECKEHIQPLLKRLKSNSLDEDVSSQLSKIVREIVHRNYREANVLYLQLSIGNSPWPMGVTNVGIHARSANEKIKTESIAHVLNDETQRKYIQAVKRLVSFAEKKYPPFSYEEKTKFLM